MLPSKNAWVVNKITYYDLIFDPLKKPHTVRLFLYLFMFQFIFLLFLYLERLVTTRRVTDRAHRQVIKLGIRTLPA